MEYPSHSCSWPGGMDRQGAEVFCLFAVGFDDYLSGFRLARHDSEQILEKVLDVDVGHFEMLVGDGDAVEAVERIGLYFPVFSVIADYVPALPEYAQEIRFDDDAVGRIVAVERRVGKTDFPEGLDGVDCHAEIAACRGYFFEHYAVGDVAGVAEHTVD